MIKLAIFDMDGTVFTSHLDWLKIRTALNIPAGGNILQEIYKENRVDEKRLEILENFEREGMLKSEPIPGIFQFLEFLKAGNMTRVLLTNNNRENTDYLLEKFNLKFDMIMTRESKLWKPDPGAFFYVMKKTGYNSAETMSIGDSHYDVKASCGAGLSLVFIIETPRSILLQKENPGIVLFRDYFDLETIMKGRGWV